MDQKVKWQDLIPKLTINSFKVPKLLHVFRSGKKQIALENHPQTFNGPRSKKQKTTFRKHEFESKTPNVSNVMPIKIRGSVSIYSHQTLINFQGVHSISQTFSACVLTISHAGGVIPYPFTNFCPFFCPCLSYF